MHTTARRAAVILGTGAAQDAPGPATTTTTRAAEPRLLGPLTGLVTTLLGTPSGSTLSPEQVTQVVTSLLGGGVPSEPALLTELLGELTEAVASPQTALDDLVSTLLAQGVPTTALLQTVNEALAPLGLQVGAEQVTGIVTELLGAGLPTDPAALLGVLTALQSGALPTGALLAPVTGVLDALAANTALPVEVRALVAGLSTQLKTLDASLAPTDLLRTVGGVLGTLGGTSAVPAPVGSVLVQLGGLLTGSQAGAPKPASQQPAARPAGSAPATGSATPDAPAAARKRVKPSTLRARVVKVRALRDGRRVRALLSCPRGAVLGCTVQLHATVDGRRSGAPRRLVMIPGTSQTVVVTMARRQTTKLRRKGGRVGAKAFTSLLGKTYTDGRALSVRRTKR